MSFKLVSVFALLTASIVTAARCPEPTAIQDADFAQKWNLTQFLGPAYYELALHDYTQPAMCGCTRSVKSLGLSDEGIYLHDNFTFICPWKPDHPSYGNLQISDLSFNFTEQPGILHGHWPVTQDLVFPDTISSVGMPDTPGEPYRWALEV